MKNDQKRHHLTPFFDENSEALTSVILEETKHVATWLFQKTKNTRRGYGSDIKKFFAYYKGKSLKQIETAHIVVFFKNHPEMKESSKARLRSAISSLYKFLIKIRYLNFNPVNGLDEIKVQDRTHEFVLDIEEVKEMIEREPNPRNRFIMKFLLKTGLRVSELRAIRPSSFRKFNGEIQTSVVGKGNKVRTFKVQNELYEEAMTLQSEVDTNAPLFRSKSTQNALSTVALFKVVERAGERIGKKGVSPHWFRHTHATLARLSGDDIRLIQYTLGHESIATTVKYTKIYSSQGSGHNIKL